LNVRRKSAGSPRLRTTAAGSRGNSHRNGKSVDPVNVGKLLTAIVIVSGFAELAYVIVNLSAMPVYIKSIKLDSKWIGLVMTAYLVVEGAFKSPCGVLGDRIGRKALILVGPIASAITSLITPFVTNPFVLVLLRIIDGLGAAALWPSAFSLIGDHVPEERRASAMGLFNVAYLMGIALGPVIGGSLNDVLHTKQASFYVAAVVFAIAAIAAYVLIPDVHKQQRAEAKLGPGLDGGFNLKEFGIMLRKMPFALLMAFVTFLGVGLVMAYAKVFIMAQFHISETQYGALLVGPAFIIAASSIPLAALGDKIGKPRAVRLGIGLCAAAFWALLAIHTTITLIIFGSLIGIGFVIAFPAWMAQVSSECEPRQRGAAVGAVGTAQGIGAIVGVALSTVLYKTPSFRIGPIHVPHHGLPFLGCGVMLAISFLLAFISVRERTAESGLPLA
jgi:DHA1 family multidrug resistance protein-like MFS transporter